MRRTPRPSPSSILSLALVAATGCADKPKTFTTKVRVEHLQSLGAAGAPASLLDVELAYVDCPGKNRAVVRGDKAFAACAAGWKIGDVVDAQIRLSYNPVRSQYRSDIVALGACARPADPKDDATYDQVSHCTDVTVHGVTMGVRCDKTRSADLVAKCGWFKRR